MEQVIEQLHEIYDWLEDAYSDEYNSKELADLEQAQDYVDKATTLLKGIK